MDYFFVILSILFATIQITVNKYYEKKYAKRLSDILFFPCITSVVASILFFAIAGFKIEFGHFSFFVALITGAIYWVISFVCVIAVRYGKMSVFSMFMMLGSLTIPFVYGAFFLNEAVGVQKIVAIILIVVALILPITISEKSNSEGITVQNTHTSRHKLLFSIFCVLIFFANGSASALSKYHQINPKALDTAQYLLWSHIFLFINSMLVFISYQFISLVKNKKQNSVQQASVDKHLLLNKKQRAISIGLICIVALMAGLTFLFQFTAAKTMPATLLFPIFSATLIILLTFSGRLFYKEKITLIMWISLALMAVGAILFLF